MNLNYAITKRREDLGLTQKELAAKTGLSYSFINDLENGRRKPSLESLDLIANALDTSVPELMGADAPEDLPEDMQEALELLHKNPKLKTLLKLGKKATKRDIDFIIAFLEKDGED